jgi:hypothetical protein
MHEDDKFLLRATKRRLQTRNNEESKNWAKMATERKHE